MATHRQVRQMAPRRRHPKQPRRRLPNGDRPIMVVIAGGACASWIVCKRTIAVSRPGCETAQPWGNRNTIVSPPAFMARVVATIFWGKLPGESTARAFGQLLVLRQALRAMSLCGARSEKFPRRIQRSAALRRRNPRRKDRSGLRFNRAGQPRRPSPHHQQVKDRVCLGNSARPRRHFHAQLAHGSSLGHGGDFRLDLPFNPYPLALKW